MKMAAVPPESISIHLKVGGYTSYFSAILTKGNFSDFLFTFLDDVGLPNIGLFLKERIGLTGKNLL